jgi:Protein of unknown function (DUF2971)
MLRMSDEQLAEILLKTAKETAQRGVENFLNSRGVTCFSETNENLLMWSHYADRGQGICLEFDTAYAPFDKFRKVDYTEDIPEIDLTQVLIEDDHDEILRLYCTKSLHWSYEREWRGIHMVADTSFTYETECLRAVYFGTEIAPEMLEIVCLILQGQNEKVQFFETSRSQFNFGVNFKEFTYMSYLESQRKKGD